MKNKKVLIGTIIGIVVLLILIVVIREIVLNKNESLDKSNEMSREAIIELLQKGSEYKNYYYASDYNDGELKTEYYIKDNLVACYIDGRISSYLDYNTNLTIRVVGDSNISISNAVIDKSTNQHGYDYSIVLEENGMKYEYLGEMQEDGRTIIVIKLSNGRNYVKFYIDKESGLILKRRDVNRGLITVYANTNNRNVKMDVVTVEDVKIDFSGYAVLNSAVSI